MNVAMVGLNVVLQLVNWLFYSGGGGEKKTYVNVIAASLKIGMTWDIWQTVRRVCERGVKLILL